MEPRTGSSGLAGLDRAGLGTLLDLLPTPMVIVEPGSGDVSFANAAAGRLAGGHFPTGPTEQRRAGPDFWVTDPEGRSIPEDQVPSARAARGEAIQNVEIDWHT